MLDFKLTKESVDWQQSIRAFVAENIIPRSDLDDHGHFPRDIYQKAFEAGIMTSMLPKDQGGGGKSYFDLVLATEELAYGDLGITTSALLLTLACGPLILFGTEKQKKEWLEPLTKELKFASFAWSEPEGSTNMGSRPASTIAEPVDGGYLISGSKSTISNATVASFYTVFARIQPGPNQLSCFLVPRKSEGVSTSEPYRKMGQRAADTGQVFFDKVFVPNEHMIGGPGQGAQIALKSIRRSRVGVGAMSVGVSCRARDLAKVFGHERKIGDGSPVIFQQDFKFRIAEMEAKIEMLRSLVWRASWELENGKNGTKLSSSAKLLGGRMAFEITNEALELLGAKGYLEEGLAEKLVRDAKVLQIYEGTETVQKMLIADTAIRLGRLRTP